MNAKDEARFWSKVEKTTGCWIWHGTQSRQGYGRFAVGRLNYPAHRLAYFMHVGAVPTGLELDHVCRNKACVNPAHLDAVTHRANVLRGAATSAANASKTHCIRGHVFDDTNTYVWPGRRKRLCHACVRARYAHRDTIE